MSPKVAAHGGCCGDAGGGASVRFPSPPESRPPEKTGRPRYVAEKLAPNGLRGSDVLCVISRSSSYPCIVIITMITTIFPI